jgi:uncharacterized protein YraI
MNIIARGRPLLVCLLLLFVVACRQSPATPIAEVVTIVPPPATAPTAKATLPVNTAVPTATPTATRQPPTATPTPAPLVVIRVVDAVSGQVVPDAVVNLALFRQTADAAGEAVFARARALSEPYTVRVTAAGYHPAQAQLIVGQGTTQWVVALEPGVFARLTAASTLRHGPGTVYPAAAEVKAGDVLEVVGQSSNGAWLVVATAAGETAWLAASDATVEGKLDQVAAVVAPATPTPAPTAVPVVAVVPPPAPPPAPQPAGPNLLSNPGFEAGHVVWARQGTWSGFQIYTAGDYPQFVRSGQRAAYMTGNATYYQRVDNVTPGTTYRFGAWVRIWSSPTEDRTVSQDPGNVAAFVCINTNGDDDPWLPTTVCSGQVRPIDTWQFISVDAPAINDRVAVMLRFTVTSGPRHNEVMWDDTYLGLAPVAATPTPPPIGPPVRPQPIPFDGVALRNSMNALHTTLVNMGGALDRLYHGSEFTCTDYEALYRQVVETRTYHSIPEAWQTVYNDYIWAADHAMATNEAIYSVCVNRGRSLTFLNYSVGRTGINDSLSRLAPAMITAEELLNQ